MKHILTITTYITLALLLTSIGATAQRAYLSTLTIKDAAVVKQGDLVEVTMTIDPAQLSMSQQDLIQLVPILTQKGNGAQEVLPPIYIVGQARYRALDRQIHLGNMEDIITDGKYITVGKAAHDLITYKEVIPYKRWMEQSELSLTSAVTACADCEKENSTRTIDARMQLTPYKPSYRLVYIEPVVEPVKRRSDTYAATLNFRVGRHELDPTYKNNRQILDEASKIIREVLNNPDLTVSDITMDGYASPEGAAPNNQRLSERRANSFANYIISRTTGWNKRINATGHGEDWTGITKLVEASQHTDKQAILDIISSVSDLDARDAKLKTLSAGQTYRWLLSELYPQVRRTDYTLSYVARAFDVEEAKQVIHTNPKLLSLNEMYLVARSYEAGSKEFKEVFDIASRLYPNQPVAVNNSAAADIEVGAYKAAIERLLKLDGNPKVWNNLGVAYALSNEYEQAKAYFEKSGTEDAMHNLQELSKVQK